MFVSLNLVTMEFTTNDLNIYLCNNKPNLLN